MPRLTSHGEVVFEATSRGRLFSSFWGDYRDWWPGEARPDTTVPPCSGCGRPASLTIPHATLDDWFAAAQQAPSDIHEHMAVLRELSRQCETVVELSTWLKPALLALAAGRPKVLKSYCPGDKPEWRLLPQLLAGATEFSGQRLPVEQWQPVANQLLFIDTLHRAEALYPLLEQWAPVCQKWIVIHCTTTYGETGDDGGPGTLPAIRRFVQAHPHWLVKNFYPNNHGLAVLSCDPQDQKPLPSRLQMAWNLAKAKTRHVLNGGAYLPLPLAQERLNHCALCDARHEEQCSACGCWLWRVADTAPLNAGQPGKVWHPTELCPLGKWPAQPEAGMAQTAAELEALLEAGPG